MIRTVADLQKFVITVTCVALSSGDDKCERCDAAMTTALKSVAAIIKKSEPMRKNNLEACNMTEISGMSTVQHNNKTCMKEIEAGPTGPCYSQTLEIKFREIRIGCVPTETPTDMSQKVVDDAIKPVKTFGSNIRHFFRKIGKRYPGELAINGSIKGIIVELASKLCFDDNIYKLTGTKVKNGASMNFELTCEGRSAPAKICAYITKSESSRSYFGSSFKDTVKTAIADIFKRKDVQQKVLLLNCFAVSLM